MNAPLPKIEDWLRQHRSFKPQRFLKPALLRGIKLWHEDETKILRIVELVMFPGDVTPVHMHEAKEKIYVGIGIGDLTVLRLLPDGIDYMAIESPGVTLVVPAKTPHAVFCKRNMARILVISSSQNADDIIWQEGSDELIKS